MHLSASVPGTEEDISVGTNYFDSAYHLGGDPFFAAIPHTAATVTVRFQIEGPGIQPLQDESWTMDNLPQRCMTLPARIASAALRLPRYDVWSDRARASRPHRRCNTPTA